MKFSKGRNLMKSRHIMVLIAMCGLAAASIGVTVNTAGVFYAPIAEDLGIGRGSVALAITILSIIASLIGMVVPKIIKENNLKILIIAACVMMVGGTLGYTICNAIWQIYAFSVIRGIGTGIISFVTITMILNYWFLAKHGLITSLAMAFSGVPGVILSPVFSKVIANSGWRQGFVMVAIATLVCILPSILFPISIRPETSGIKPYGYEEFMKAKDEGQVLQLTGTRAVFNFANPKFILAVIVTIASSVVSAVPQHFPGYATSIGFAAEVGALMLSVSMAFNIISKLATGVMTDRFGAYKTVMIMAAVNITAIVLLLFFRQAWALYAGAGMFATTFAVGAVGIAMIAGYLFGMDYYPTVYPILSFVGGASNAAAATLVGTLYDATGTYTVNFWLALGCQIILIAALTAACSIRKHERHSGIESV